MALARLLRPLHDICNMEIGCWAPVCLAEDSELAGGDRASSTGHSNEGSAAPPLTHHETELPVASFPAAGSVLSNRFLLLPTQRPEIWRPQIPRERSWQHGRPGVKPLPYGWLYLEYQRIEPE